MSFSSRLSQIESDYGRYQIFAVQRNFVAATKKISAWRFSALAPKAILL